jgi:hypothetical protein
MNSMQTLNLLVWQLRRAWAPARVRAWRPIPWALIGLLLVGGLPVSAQEGDETGQTNDLTAEEVLAQLNEMVQAAQSGQPEDIAPSDESAAAGAQPQASTPAPSGNRFDRGSGPSTSSRSQGPSRSQSDDRRSRSRRSFRSKSDPGSSSRSSSDYRRSSDGALPGAPEGTNSSLSRLDYAAFRIIADRNIFDPNRVPHRPNESRVRSTPKIADSLTLVGTMSYEKGTFAFFDGSRSDYKKALKQSDVIAGYKVTNIAPNGVTLAAGTNSLELSVGMQLRREEDGPWRLSGQSGTYTAAPPSTSSNAVAASATTGSEPATGASESDVIKRLMQKRQQE